MGGQGWCLDVGPTVNPYVNPCTLEPAASMPFCDTTLPLATRVANLVGNLTLVRAPLSCFPPRAHTRSRAVFIFPIHSLTLG